jgi:hypothetical protein
MTSCSCMANLGSQAPVEPKVQAQTPSQGSWCRSIAWTLHFCKISFVNFPCPFLWMRAWHDARHLQRGTTISHCTLVWHMPGISPSECHMIRVLYDGWCSGRAFPSSRRSSLWMSFEVAFCCFAVLNVMTGVKLGAKQELILCFMLWAWFYFDENKVYLRPQPHDYGNILIRFEGKTQPSICGISTRKFENQVLPISNWKRWTGSRTACSIGSDFQAATSRDVHVCFQVHSDWTGRRGFRKSHLHGIWNLAQNKRQGL